MSREIDRLHGFFDWLLTPHNFPESDSQWKQRYLKKLSRRIERLRNDKVMRPSKEIDDAIASLRREQEKFRRGFVYVMSGSEPGGGGVKELRFLAKGKLRGETEKRFFAVLIARYLYPEQSAYKKVREGLEKWGIHCEEATLRQGYRRFLKELTGERTEVLFKLISEYYAQFRCEKLWTARHPRKHLVVTASETALLLRIAEGWQITFRKKQIDR